MGLLLGGLARRDDLDGAQVLGHLARVALDDLEMRVRRGPEVSIEPGVPGSTAQVSVLRIVDLRLEGLGGADELRCGGDDPLLLGDKGVGVGMNFREPLHSGLGELGSLCPLAIAVACVRLR